MRPIKTQLDLLSELVDACYTIKLDCDGAYYPLNIKSIHVDHEHSHVIIRLSDMSITKTNNKENHNHEHP